MYTCTRAHTHTHTHTYSCTYVHTHNLLYSTVHTHLHTYILNHTHTHTHTHTALGLLPFIDNFAQIGGFIFGVVSSFIFVPYISVGKWDRAKKLCLVSIAVPVILVLYLVAFVIFYNNPNPDFCPECNYINCIPFTDTFCDDFINSVLPPELNPIPPS